MCEGSSEPLIPGAHLSLELQEIYRLYLGLPAQCGNVSSSSALNKAPNEHLNSEVALAQGQKAPNGNLKSTVAPPSHVEAAAFECISQLCEIGGQAALQGKQDARDERLKASDKSELGRCSTPPVEDRNFLTSSATSLLQPTPPARSAGEPENVVACTSGTSKPDDGTSSYQCSLRKASFPYAWKLSTHACCNKDDRLFHCDQCPNI